MVTPIDGRPRYSAQAFAAPAKSCDLVMKGGITSGVVYPYAILQLATDYRFRSIGGTSAGAIAAAFAAAAEFGRRSGHPEAFTRFESRCLEIPAILGGLFQPEPPLKPLMRALQALSASPGQRGWLRAYACFGPQAVAGALLGGAAMALLAVAAAGHLDISAWPGLILGASLGALAGPGLRVAQLTTSVLPKNGFGLCSGMPVGGGGPALTDWLHRSLQFIAFGDETHPQPLTFGHLARAGRQGAPEHEDEREIDLRMITTNLSMRRPHALPKIGGSFLFRVEKWSKLFPKSVIAYLEGMSLFSGGPVAQESRTYSGYRQAPEPDDLPVIVAVRMSLSFPVLIQAVPMSTIDLAPAAPDVPLGDNERPALPLVDVWFSDGGISSNFPIHFFDALLPTRPTFALSLDALQASDNPEIRVSLPQTAAAGSFGTILPIASLPQFAGAILDSAKDWQDQMLSVMPGQRERIAHIRLDKAEGGPNLAMPVAGSLRSVS